MKSFIFYLFSIVLLLASVAVITVRNSVNAALFLVLAFVMSAGLWVLLEAEFLALNLIMVYVGAVMVLFLFVVMMININYPSVEKESNYIPAVALMVMFIIAEMYLAFGSLDSGIFPEVDYADGYSNTAELGKRLYTDYVYPFEIAGVILLVAIVSAISLTYRKRESAKYLDPARQVSVHRDERLRIVKMPAVQK